MVCRVNSFSPLLPTGSIAHDAICDFPGISNYQAQLASKIGELGVNMSDIFPFDMSVVVNKETTLTSFTRQA